MNGDLILRPAQYPDSTCPLHPYIITGLINVSLHSFTKVQKWYVFSLFFRILSYMKKHKPAWSVPMRLPCSQWSQLIKHKVKL